MIYLETPLEVAVSRCETQPGGDLRPILEDRARLAQRFARRVAHYRQAHLTLPTAGRTPAELVAGVNDALTLRLRVPSPPR